MTKRNFNNVTTIGTLTAPVASSAVSMSVQNFAQFPAVPFTVTVDRNTSTEEICLVTGVGGSVLTVTRGFDGSAAQAHAAGATIEHTAGAIEYTEANAHVIAVSDVHGVSGALLGAEGVASVFDKTLVSPIVQADTTAGDAVVAYDPTGTRNLFRGMNINGDDVITVDTTGKVFAAAVDVAGNTVAHGTLAVTGAATMSGVTALAGGATVPAGKKLTLTDAPAAATDAANKSYVDGKTWPSSAINDGASAATPSKAVVRDASGRAQVVDPAVAADIATKNYVDTHVSTSDTGWKTLTLNGAVSPGANGAQYRVINGVCYLMISETTAAPSYSSTLLHTTLPAEARPAVAQFVVGGYLSNTIEMLKVNTDGTVVNTLGSGSSPGGFFAHGSFPVNP